MEKSKDDYDIQKEEFRKNIKIYNSKLNLNKVFSNWGPYNSYGPEFYTLNKHLQEELVDLLNKLEVTADINNYIRYLGLNRERREYVRWLFRLNEFLNK